MSVPIYDAKRPDQIVTFPQVKAFEIKREFDTISNLQAFKCSPFELDLGQPDDTTTLIIRFFKNGRSYTLLAGYVLVLLPTGDYEVYPSTADFLAVYALV